MKSESFDYNNSKSTSICQLEWLKLKELHKKNINIKKLFFSLLLFFCFFVGGAKAGVSYGGYGNYEIYILSPTNAHNLPSLYSELVSVYNESYVKENALNEISPGVWWCSGLIVPQNVPFYINSSTATEVHLMNDYRGWALEGYPLINNTKLVGWNREENRPNTFSETGQMVLYTPFHNVEFENFRQIYSGYLYEQKGIANLSFYNIIMKNFRVGWAIQFGENLTVNNVTIRDGGPTTGAGIYESGFNNSTLSNITCINVSDPSAQSTYCYGLMMGGSNNIVRDVYVNGTGWSGTCFGPWWETDDNNTFENITVDRAGHNGFENALNNSTFKDIKVSNSDSVNFFQFGDEGSNKTTCGNIYENITSSNPGGAGFEFLEGSRNSSIRNSTFIDRGIFFLTSDNCTAINCTEYGQAGMGNSNQASSSGDVEWFRYCTNDSFIDCNLYNNENLDIQVEDANPLHIINTNYTKLGIYNPVGHVYRYYYPNITVIDTLGDPVEGAAITVNTSAKNGYGKDQTRFITDVNGKLYDSGNRTNWLAIPETSGNSNYITKIIASKKGQTDSKIVDPDPSWYSPNPASLRSPEIVLTLGTSVSVPVANPSGNITSGNDSSSRVTITPEYQVVSPGKQFAVNIKVEPSTAITGAQSGLLFQGSMANVNRISEGNLFSESGAKTYFSNGTVDSSAGLNRYIYCSALGNSSVSSPGILATTNLTAGNSIGIAKFNLSNVTISDSNSSPVPNTIKNASVLIDTAPVLDLIGPKSVNETNALNFKVNASDVDGTGLTFSASGLPASATFNQSTRVFTWVSSKGQAGNYTITFKVSDGYLNDSEDVKITVKKLNNAPVITSFEPANGSTFNKGGNVRIALNASDADNQALSYTIKIDGKTYSTSSSYVWETNYSSSGNHTIEMTVSDSIEEVKKINTVYINDYHSLWDVKEDGIVDILDITSIARHYGEIYTNKPYPRWDVNQDGVINIQDLYLGGDHFGETVN